MITQEQNGGHWNSWRSSMQGVTGRLVLHCGADATSLDDVLAVEVPPATDTWQPVSHGVVLGEVVEALGQSGMVIKDAAYALTKGGSRFFGLLEMGKLDHDYGLVIGVRNSMDKSFPASLATGTNVFCCDNLSFSAEVIISRRHTKNILRDFPGLVQRAVGQIGMLAEREKARIEAYRGYQIDEWELNNFLVNSVVNSGLPVTKLMDVRGLFREPIHEEHKGGTAWTLLNAYTEVLKGSLQQLPKRTQVIHGMLDQLAGVKYEAPVQVQFDRVVLDEVAAN